MIVEKMHLHYGLKDKNPVSRMRFYSKSVFKDLSSSSGVNDAHVFRNTEGQDEKQEKNGNYFSSNVVSQNEYSQMSYHHTSHIGIVY